MKEYFSKKYTQLHYQTHWIEKGGSPLEGPLHCVILDVLKYAWGSFSRHIWCCPANNSTPMSSNRIHAKCKNANHKKHVNSFGMYFDRLWLVDPIRSVFLEKKKEQYSKYVTDPFQHIIDEVVVNNDQQQFHSEETHQIAQVGSSSLDRPILVAPPTLFSSHH